MTRETLWLIIGFAGQAVFTGRFVLQWLYSELKRRVITSYSIHYTKLYDGRTAPKIPIRP